MSSDGTQHPPLQFPSGGHMIMFLQCMESTVNNIGGKLDPPLSTMDETNLSMQKSQPEPVSADAAKAKLKFPWFKKEVSPSE